MKAVLLFVTLLFLGATTAQARSVKAEIDAANQQWIAAFNKGDAAAVAALYTDQATVLPPGADIAKGRDAIQKVWAGAIQSGLKNITLQTVAVEQFGNAAREIGRFSADVTNPQKPTVHVDGKYVVLWKRLHGAWKLDTDIWNMNQ
jgi:uncharacterized protein (TIGR02246 family)